MTALSDTGGDRREIIPAGEEAKLLADTIMPGASMPELKFFAEVCNRMNLDPFRREIHAVKRRVQENGQWVERWVYQTGIDGYRKRAAATGVYAGSEVITEPETAPVPTVARATVYRMVGGQRVSFTATARWSEYVQTNREGKPSAMWAKMPHTMLEKVAEAKALRRAFPDELNGVYAEEEMHQADNTRTAAAEPVPTSNPFARKPATAITTVDAEMRNAEPRNNEWKIADVPPLHAEVVAKCAGSNITPKQMEDALCSLYGEDVTWTTLPEKQLRQLLEPARWAKVVAAVEERAWKGDAA